MQEMSAHIEKLRLDLAETKSLNLSLLKQNTQLHAVNKQLAEAATKNMEAAAIEIDKLQSLLQNIIASCVDIVWKHFPEDEKLYAAEDAIKKLSPLKVG